MFSDELRHGVPDWDALVLHLLAAIVLRLPAVLILHLHLHLPVLADAVPVSLPGA